LLCQLDIIYEINQEKNMPLQQLINHFNDRFEKEHHSRLHPFILENSRVSGIFGPIRISNSFYPVRSAENHV